METKRKTVYRLSELAELRRRLQEPLTFQGREGRRRIFARMNQIRDSMASLPGDVKHWIRSDRGEGPDGRMAIFCRRRVNCQPMDGYAKLWRAAFLSNTRLRTTRVQRPGQFRRGLA